MIRLLDTRHSSGKCDLCDIHHNGVRILEIKANKTSAHMMLAMCDECRSELGYCLNTSLYNDAMENTQRLPIFLKRQAE